LGEGCQIDLRHSATATQAQCRLLQDQAQDQASLGCLAWAKSVEWLSRLVERPYARNRAVRAHDVELGRVELVIVVLLA
jgi:hypothetical protein